MRIANRCRQNDRPEEPEGMDFVIQEECLPANFFRADIEIGKEKRRHLIFATDRQLELLASAQRWYVDGTFWVVKQPFTQLLTIHAFLSEDDCVKQVPLAFCLMSGKSTSDYKAVILFFLNYITNHNRPIPRICQCYSLFQLASHHGTGVV